uniref:Uncharacterized protein n=1 Tax=viral metagenome TaxID=1070528 RepID=A0A6C0L9F8_9ZZZZ
MEGLIDTRNEYIEHIQDILSVAISKRIYAIYTEIMEEKKGLKGFQNELYSIRKWNNNIVNDEYKKIVKYTKCKYLSNLIKIIIITTIKIKIYEYRDQFDNIKIKIPNPEDFVHKCYINAASFSWKNAYLYNRNNIKDAEYQNNLNLIEENIRAIIKKTFRDFVPFDEIFKQIEDNLTENVNQYKETGEDQEDSEDDEEDDEANKIEIAKSSKKTKKIDVKSPKKAATKTTKVEEVDQEDEEDDEDKEDDDDDDEEDEDDEDDEKEGDDNENEDEEEDEDDGEEDEEDGRDSGNGKEDDEEDDEEDDDEDDDEDGRDSGDGEEDGDDEDDEDDDEEGDEDEVDVEEDKEDDKVDKEIVETKKVMRETLIPAELEDNKINNIVDTPLTKFNDDKYKNEAVSYQNQEISFSTFAPLTKSKQENLQDEEGYKGNQDIREKEPNIIRKEWNNIKNEYNSLSQNKDDVKIDFKRYDNEDTRIASTAITSSSVSKSNKKHEYDDDDAKSVSSVTSSLSNITDTSQIKKIHIKEGAKGKKPSFF